MPPVCCRTMLPVTMVMVVLLIGIVIAQGDDISTGPQLDKELPQLAEFINTRGIKVDCTAKGHPTPAVTWVSVGTTPLNNITGIRTVYPNGSLVFSPFQPDQYRQDLQAATYRCLASNNVGTVSSLDVQIRAVLHQPYDVQVYDSFVIEGSTSVFICHVPSVIRQYIEVLAWIRNDHLLIQPKGIEDLTDKYSVLPTGELHVRDTNPSDAGTTYKCKTIHRLTGEIQISSSAGHLFVTEAKGSVPPRILGSDLSISANKGATVIIPCVTQGNPAPTVRWSFKDGSGHLKPVSEYSRFRHTKSTLIIQDVQLSDEGEYFCEAVSDIGKEGTDIRLSITERLVAKVSPAVLLAKLNHEMAFKCEIFGHPLNSIQWLHNGSPVLNQTTNLLHISRVKVTDRGMYQCIAKNAEMAVQGTAELKLTEITPYWISTFNETTEHRGNPISVHCRAAAIPPANISWSLDGIALSKSQHKISSKTDKDGHTTSTLRIPSAKLEDGGVYTCTAANDVGETRHSARINIYGPLQVRQVPTLVAISGTTLLLNCPFYGYPIQSIFWEKDGVELPTEIRHNVMSNGTLSIESVHRSTESGKFTCRVYDNDQNDAEGFINVQVMGNTYAFYFMLKNFFLASETHCSVLKP